MKRSSIIHYNFYFDFFEESVLPAFYTEKYGSIDNDDSIKKIGLSTENPQYKLHVVNYIPDYFQLEKGKLPSTISFMKVSRYRGFLINLDKYSNVDDYMKSQMGLHKRQIMKRVKRLETCFNPTYRLYYGNISENIYNSLFIKSEEFLRKRFSQKKSNNEQLMRWEFYKRTTIKRIRQKQASLFVIYNENEPISISLNYHFHHFMIHTINSYNTDYSKFGLGNTAIYKLVDWCFKNGYKTFDFQWGDLPYKRVWSNHTCGFNSHIFYKKNFFIRKIMAHVMVMNLGVKKWIGKIEVFFFRNVDYVLLKLGLIKDQFNKTKLDYLLKDIDGFKLDENFIPIDIPRQTSSVLKKAVCDFQYLNFEPAKNIKVYNIDDSYIIVGRKKAQKVCLL